MLVSWERKTCRGNLTREIGGRQEISGDSARHGYLSRRFSLGREGEAYRPGLGERGRRHCCQLMVQLICSWIE